MSTTLTAPYEIQNIVASGGATESLPPSLVVRQYDFNFTVPSNENWVFIGASGRFQSNNASTINAILSLIGPSGTTSFNFGAIGNSTLIDFYAISVFCTPGNYTFRTQMSVNGNITHSQRATGTLLKFRTSLT